MGNKPSMSRSERLRREKVTRYSIRKYSFGAASVAVAALFMFLGNGAVSANELGKQDSTVIEKNLEDKAPQEGDKAVQADASVTEVTSKPEESAKPTPTLDKSQLESYIAEIEEKISAGKYANKTEESIALLNSELASAKSVLASATSQDELKAAYNKFVTVVSSKLQNKPVEKKETPVVDTTNGKETVGKKAENTEKKSDSNSIENTGSNDPRNGKELDRNNAFRAETDTEKPTVSITYDDAPSRTIWVTPTEPINLTDRIKITDNSGKIVKAWMQKMGGGTDTDLGYGLHNSSVDGETPATNDSPVTLSITGTLQPRHPNGNPWTDGGLVISRKVRAKDASANEIDNAENNPPEATVWFKVRSQNVKYAQDLTNKAENFDKIVVADTAQIQQSDLDIIKAKLQDGADNNLNGKIDTVTQVGDKIVVTYNDGTTTERPVTDFARVNVKPVGNIPFSNSTTKEIYVYKGEETNIELSATDDSGKLKDIRIGEGSRGNNLPGAAGARINNQYGLTFSSQRNETDGIVATQDNPAKVTITGTISVPNKPTYTGKLVTRYLVAEDLDGAVFSEPTGNTETANPLPEGYFKLWVREQTQKYDIQAQTNEAGKIAVADVNNLSQADFEKIKNNIKITYNTADDARLLDKNGKLVENASNYIDTVTKQGDQIVVTYKDGSTDSVALTSVLRNNPLPTVKVPYSNQAEKQVYVYTGENTDLTFTANDDTAVKDMYLRGPGDVNWNNAEGFGFTTGKIDNGVVTGKGTISDNKQEATIKMTGVTNLDAGKQWTSYVVANDNDNFSSMPADRNFNALDIDPDAKSKPGYIRFVVKDQTSKYDIAAPTEKVAVADPDNVTKEDLAKIEGKLKLEYSNNNDDANLADKKGKNVDDKDSKIQSVTKDDQGNLVVTYKDGSTDKRKLSEFVSLDKQPAITAVNQAAENKIAEINKTPNATDEEKAAAIAKVNADKEKAVAAINDANVTTKDAIDKAQNAGTTAIAGDNPVVAKKAAAKADVEAARQAKADAINADKNLTQAEKDAALAKVNKAAEDATKAIDAATTNAAVDTAKGTGITEIGKVNPVAKENAKEAIGNALTAKNNEIDGRKDLTQAEKDAAKAEAKKLADAELTKVNAQPDNAETAGAAAAAQKLVNDAEDKGVADVTSVYPIAKEQAKKAVADELAKKEKELDARKDLTTEEKEAAKKEAKDLAKKATDAINAQPAIADTSDKATAAQTAVDTAKTKGVAEVKAVNPEAVKKNVAKKAIEDALTAKNNAIDARDDLTPEQKTAAKEAAKAKADAAKDAIDKATTDADVDQAKTDGETAVANVTPVAKEPAKQAIAKALEDKNAEIDKRTDLTDEEKATAKKEAKDKADAQLAEIAKQPDVADTPEAAQTAQTAVDTAKKTGVDEVTAVNPTAVTKPEAKKAIDAKLAEQLKTIESTPDATDEEKKVAADQAKFLAEEAKKAIDDKTTDAEVNKFTDDVKAAIEKVLPVVEDKPNARKAIDEEATAKKEAIDARTDLTPKAKEDLKAQVDKIAEQAKKAVDKATTSEAVNGIEESDKAAIKAVGEVNIPADKVLVNDPSALTDDEKAKVLEAVKKVNPDAKEITQDADGNITVTTPDGHQETITPEQVVKTSDTANEPKAGNDVVKPANKVVVADPAKLTDAEKEKIKAAVEAVNPNSVVTVDEKGNAKVSTPDGQTQVIPVDELVRTAEDTKKPNAGDDVVTPASKTVVANPDSLTPEEKKAIEDKVKEVNPGATVVVDDKGNATVTTPSGKTAVIPAADLTKTAEAATKPNAGDDVVKPASKTVVANPEALTPEEKKAIEDKVKAVNPGATVVVDDKGNATVTTPSGKTAVIPAADLTKTAEAASKPNAGDDVITPASKTVVANPEALTPEEKKAIEDKVKAVNPGATVVVDDKGNATVTTPSGKTAVIPASALTKTAEAAAKPNAGDDVITPASKTVVANPEALTPEEKKAIEDKVKAVNPGATVVVDDKGNATVTTPSGKTAVIPAADLTKTAEAASKPNAGDDVVKPASKTVVANPEALTPEEEKAIEDKVKAVNPGATVVVDDKGNATVTTPSGKTAVIPAADLTKTAEAATKPNAGDDVVKPASKTVVANPEALTPEEKKAIEDKVKAVNPGATVVVDDKGNATVTTPSGKTAVIPASALTKTAEAAAKPNAGDDVVTPASKTVVANPDSLTPEEKKAIEDKVKEVNPGATVVVDDKGNATVTTPSGKTAVIPASALTKTAEAATKPNAGDDVVTPASKTVVANPDSLTPEEKKAIEDKVKEVNPGATVVVDDKGNATVTTPSGKTAVIPASALTKTAEAATKPNAGDDVVTPASKTVVANPDSLTPEEKKAIEDKVKEVNPGATVVVDDKGNATVTTPSGKTAVIPAADLTKTAEVASKPNAGDDVITPASKTVVANPEALTPEEKKAIEDKVKAVNPGSTVVVDDKGNATVTTPSGKTAVIPAADLTKTAEAASKPNAGDDVITPASKTVVANPEALTPEEKKAIEDKVKAVNPGSTVVVDDKGNATVTTPSGKTAVIPAADLTKTAEAASKPNAGDDVVTPASKTVVANPEALTPEEKKAIEDKVKAVNPGSTVVVDDKGNATVTTPSGKTAVIPAADLTKTAEAASKPNAGDDVVTPASKTVVANPEALTPEEKKAIEDKVKAVNPGSTVVVDDKGNATVTTPSGKTAVIPAADLTKTAEAASKPNAGDDVITPASKTVVANPEALTPEEKKAIEDKVKAVNPGSTVVVDDKGNATVTTPSGKTAVIPAADLTKTAEAASKPNAGDDVVTPASKTVVANPEALTPEEKKAIEDKVKAVNPGSTVVVDDKGNATVTTPSGKTAVIPAADLTKTAEAASKPNAGDDVITPASKTVVANPEALTPEEKKAIEDKVKAVNPGSTVVVDDKGNATVTTPSGKTAVIPAADLTKTAEAASKPNAGDDVITPASKTVVANPDSLTPEEKKAIEDKVKAVNPGATVVVDDKGNATVTTPSGKTAVIPASALTKTAEAAAKPNAGDDVVTPASKTVVANPEALTPEEKKAIEDKVKAVNPGATVVVDDKGNATVTTPSGKTAVIPAADLTKTAEVASKPNAGNDINTPAIKTAVANKDALTDAEKEAVKKAVSAVNPGATVVVDDKGNATVTTPSGKTAVIPASKLVIPTEKLADLSEQNGVNIPATRTLVADKNNLTPEEIAKIKIAVEAVNPGSTVVVDEKGNATVTTVDGKTATISAEQLVKDEADVATKNNGENLNLDFEKQLVANLDNLTDADKAGAKAKIMAANPDVAEVIFDDKGNATVILNNGKAYTVLAKDIFKEIPYVPSYNGGNNRINNAETANVNTVAKELPNTGTEANASLAALGLLGALGGFGLLSRKKKED